MEDASPAAAAHATFSGDESYRYCTEGLVRGDALPDEDQVRAFLREQGDSIVVIRTGNLLKIHVHTDEPELVFDWLRGHGTLAAHKAEDMRSSTTRWPGEAPVPWRGARWPSSPKARRTSRKR
jgi:dihydroxyacetone kinase-like predicted kinase